MRKKKRKLATLMAVVLFTASTQNYGMGVLANESESISTINSIENLSKDNNPESFPISTTGTAINISPIPTSGASIAISPAPTSGASIAISPAPTSGSPIAVSPAPTSGSPIAISPAPTSGSPIAVSPAPTSGSPIAISPAPTSGSPIAVSPAPTSGPSIDITPVPTSGDSIDITPTPTIDPVIETPFPTTTPASQTPTPVPTVTPVPYKKGKSFQWKNYVYTVVKTPTKTTAGQVYVKQVASVAVKKTSLSVQSSFTIDGFSYQIIGITKNAFKACSALQTITIKSGTTFIGQYAFQDVTTLKTVILPDSVTVIKSGAFSGCTALRQITLPTGITTIRGTAFANCTKLNAILVLSKSISAIGKNAFKNTKSGCYMVVLSGKKTTYRAMLNSSGAKSMIIYTY